VLTPDQNLDPDRLIPNLLVPEVLVPEVLDARGHTQDLVLHTVTDIQEGGTTTTTIKGTIVAMESLTKICEMIATTAEEGGDINEGTTTAAVGGIIMTTSTRGIIPVSKRVTDETTADVQTRLPEPIKQTTTGTLRRFSLRAFPKMRHFEIVIHLEKQKMIRNIVMI